MSGVRLAGTIRNLDLLEKTNQLGVLVSNVEVANVGKLPPFTEYPRFWI